MKPKSANRVIAQLRELSPSDEVTMPQDGKEVALSEFSRSKGPIHAVCLAYPDAEEHNMHFANLGYQVEEDQLVSQSASAISTSLRKLNTLFSEMHVIDLIRSPDFGLGQPGDGEGILAGAVPTAETVITGIEEITPQLMALGYATGKAILPDHSGIVFRTYLCSLYKSHSCPGIYPPTDRISVFTCKPDLIPAWSYLTFLDQIGGGWSLSFRRRR